MQESRNLKDEETNVRQREGKQERKAYKGRQGKLQWTKGKAHATK